MIKCRILYSLLLLSVISAHALSRHRSLRHKPTVTNESDSESVSNETLDSSSSSKEIDDDYYDNYDYDLSGTSQHGARTSLVFIALLTAVVHFL